MIEQSKKAIAAPFRLEECLKITDSQLAGLYHLICVSSDHITLHCHVANLDEISDLKDPDLFQAKVLSEVRARAAPGNEKNQLELLRKPNAIASLVAAR